MIGGERSQDSPLSKPKAAERYAKIPLQTVRTRRRLPPVIPPHLRPDKTHKKQFILHEKTIHTSLQRERIKKIASEFIWSFTWTNQAFFSSRRALLIQSVIKVPFFRFGGIPDWQGWWSLGEWSGYWPVFPMLARRAVTTLAEVAYLRWRGWSSWLAAMWMSQSLVMSK